MSLSIEFATQLVNSPSKRKKKINDDDFQAEETDITFQEIDEQECSPTRVMDFPCGQDDPGIIPRQLLEELSITPLEDSHQSEEQPVLGASISPISSKSRRRPKIKRLPSLAELHQESSHDLWSNTTLSSGKKRPQFLETKLPKPKPNPALKKVTRRERITELCDSASTASSIGDEPEAVAIYRRARRIAESELHRLRSQLSRSHQLHPAAVRSILIRLQEDWLEAATQLATIQLELTALYEREGEYESAIQACQEAKTIFKKQRKRIRSFTQSKTDEPDSPISNDSEEDPIPWYVDCPDVDRHLKVAARLLDRLRASRDSYTDRKKNLEDTLMLRQECLSTPDPKKRAALYEMAEAQGKHALRKEQKALGKSHPQTVDVLHVLSALALDQNKKEEAIQYLLQSFDLHKRAMGEKHPRTGHDLLLLARATDDHRSVTYYEQAAAVFRCAKCGGRVVGSILNDLAVIHVARHEFEKALELLEEALTHFQDSAEIEDGDEDSLWGSVSVNVDVVQVWRNMGECHMNLQRAEQAAKCFSTALENQRLARRDHDSAVELSSSDLDSSAADEKTNWDHLMQMISDESVADTLRRLGRALSSAKKFTEAISVYNEAVQIHRSALNNAKVLAMSGMLTKVPTKQDQLAATLYNVGEVQDAMGDDDSAVQTFNEAMQLRLTSDEQRPESQRCNMVHCAMCLVGIANVRYKQSQFVESHKLYNNALFFCEAQKIPFDNPLVKMIEKRRKEAEHRIAEDPNRDVELTRLEQRAAIQVQKKQFNEAIRTLGEAIAIRQATVDKLKSNGSNLCDESKAIVRLLNCCSKVFMAKGDKENAQRARRDALVLQRQSAAAIESSLPRFPRMKVDV